MGKGMAWIYQQTLQPPLSWSLMKGGVVSGQNPKEMAGWSVSISGDGNVVAVGAPKYCGNGGGCVRILEYDDIFGEWEYGSMLESLNSDEAAGYSVSLSRTGHAMVMGFP